MTQRLWLLAAVVVALLLVGCGGGGGDPLDLDAYLSEMERLDNEAEARQATLTQEFEAATAGDPGSGSISDQFRASLETYYIGLVDTGKDFINQVEDLEPPDEAQDVHDEYVEAYDDLLVELNKVVDEIPGIATRGELDALLAGPDLTDAFERGNRACNGLQELASDNNIDVDFGCQS